MGFRLSPSCFCAISTAVNFAFAATARPHNFEEEFIAPQLACA
jgi:hypothetical protein